MKISRIKILVCEDHDAERKLLCGLLKRFDDLDIAGAASDGAEGIRLAEIHRPQLVFLDIDMPRKSGLELIEDLKTKGINPYYIFVSGHGSYAVHAWDVGAVDFLAKPVNIARLTLAIERARIVLKGDMDRKPRPGFTFKNGRNIITVPHDEIICISSSKKHSVLHTLDGDYEVSRLISDLEASLPPELFFRIHKQFIVNINYIFRLESLGSGRYKVHLTDELDILPVGASYSRDLLDRIKKSRN